MIYVKSSALREAKQRIRTFRIFQIFGTHSGSRWLMHLTLQRRFITLCDHKLFNKKRCHINQQGNGSPLSTNHWRTCDPMDARVSWTYMARIRLYSEYHICVHMILRSISIGDHIFMANSPNLPSGDLTWLWKILIFQR